MVRNTQRTGRMTGSEVHVRDTDLDGTTLSDTEFRPVFSIQGDKTNAYAPGFGTADRRGTAGFADLDLQNGNDNPVQGQLRYEVYRDSQREDLIATGSKYSLATLRADVAADKTDKTMIEQQQPVAGEDAYLVISVKADSSSNGDTVSGSNSSVDIGMPYSEIKR